MSEPIEEPQEGEPAEGEESQFQPPETPQEPEPEEAAAEEAGDTPEPEPEPEPEPQGLSEKEAEKRAEKLENESKRHRNRLAEILQEDILAFQPCPLCPPNIEGWMPAGPIPEEVKAQVRIALGDREPENWKADPHSRRCEACDGQGEVLTGSRREDQRVAGCVDCMGRGWIGDRVAAGTPPTLVMPPAERPNGAPAQGFSPDDMAEAQRLRDKGMVVITPPPPPL